MAGGQKDMDPLGASLLAAHTSVDFDGDTEDIIEERMRVEAVSKKEDEENAIVIRGLRKVFPGVDGGARKVCKAGGTSTK